MRLRWLASASLDLARIVDDIALDNPNAADAVELRLLKAVEHLATFPDAGRKGRVTGTRELVVADYPYVVIYRSKSNRVEILTVLHAARQWPPQAL